MVQNQAILITPHGLGLQEAIFQFELPYGIGSYNNINLTSHGSCWTAPAAAGFSTQCQVVIALVSETVIVIINLGMM